MIGILIVMMGLLFFLQALGLITTYAVSVIWPVLLILIGIKKVMKGVCMGCDCGKDDCCKK